MENVGIIFNPEDEKQAWSPVLYTFGVPQVPTDIPGATKVYLVIKEQAIDAITLPEFKHPARAVYIFGSDSGAALYPPEGAVKVTIPTERRTQGLYACQAAAIVLYDRLLKEHIKDRKI